jgi:hypothetical protein
MGLLASDFLGKSRFLKADDLKAGEKKVRIKAVTAEVITQQGESPKTKLTLWFTNDERGFPLNITNNMTLRATFGDDTDLWIGKIVVLFTTMVDFRGQMVPAVRVRVPPLKQAAAAGNGQAAAVKPQQKIVDPELDEEPSAKPKTLGEALDDDIPWK